MLSEFVRSSGRISTRTRTGAVGRYPDKMFPAIPNPTTITSRCPPKPKVKCRSIDQKVSERTRVASPLPRQHVRLRGKWTSISAWHSNAPPSCTDLITNCSRASIQTCVFSHRFSLYRQTTPKSIRTHLSQLLARQPTSRVCLQPITGQCEVPTGSE